MKRIYSVEISDISDDIFYYPSELTDMQEINTVCFGHSSARALIKRNPSITQSIVISKSLAERLNFPDTETPIHLFIYGKDIHIGPLVGVFSSGFSTIQNKPLGERTSFFSKLLSLNKATGCIPFMFGENHIDWENETITGYMYHQHTWETYQLPFPNVVYDRLPNRKTEGRSGPREVKQTFQEKYAIPWYNPGFFNKWDVYERLSDDPRAINFLPETYPFQSLSVIETLLSKYRQVYIKPIHGSLGLGIHQVLYDKHDQVYYCRYKNEQKENKLKKFQSLEAIFSHVFKEKRLHNMIVQQGIPLIRSEKRHIDFRVHTNKDQDGIWQVTAMAAKIAGAGSVTTHIKSGGTIKTIEELFVDPETVNEVREKLTNAALILSECMEEHLDGIIAEIGFDLGIDKKGKVWMFEANSKPGRSIFSHPKLREFELLTRKLSLDYAVYLAEKSITSSGSSNG